MDLNYSSEDRGRHPRVPLHMGLKSPEKNHLVGRSTPSAKPLYSYVKETVRKLVRVEKIEKIFLRFSIFWSRPRMQRGRLIYKKVSLWTCLHAQKTHMAISDDLRPLCLPEGSTSHFKNTKNTIFGKKYKIHVWDVGYGHMGFGNWKYAS